ncbi:MAG: RNA polymerase sigma factor, partial [Anaerolineales bacterium]|nr:RNA polymerase sigma factor [Anaerolineales bacterium]
MLDDDTLMQQAPHRPEAFGALYDRYVDRIHAYAYRLTQDEALAQDVTAATFEKALTAVRRSAWRGGSVAAWLFRIAHNEAMSQHRRRKWLAPWRAWRGGAD